jgi:protein-L-isoaspartate O-methyltransferase
MSRRVELPPGTVVRDLRQGGRLVVSRRGEDQTVITLTAESGHANRITLPRAWLEDLAREVLNPVPIEPDTEEDHT